MPKIPPPKPKAVSVVGLKRLESGSELTFSDGRKLTVSKVTTLGWDAKLKEAPIFIVNETQFKNEVPLKQLVSWRKSDYQASVRGAKE